ncbi:MAG: acyltransferase [Alphaproteobacteria bacterium]|nr:acyltransferase [Alphaproteobacteria bacterium]
MSNLSAPAPRYQFIDAIRGMAACLVMLQHSLYASGLLGDWPHEQLTGFIPNYLEFGETGVVAFFLVSGFVIPLSLEKTNNFRLFWLHRVLRIYPLYLAVYFVTLAVQAGGGLHGAEAFARNFAAHLFLVQEYVKQPNFVGGSWTLSIEMVWYIGLSALFLLGLNRKTGLLVALAAAVSALACVVCANGIHVPMGRLSMLVCCVLGLLCYRFEAGVLSSRRFAFLASVLLAVIAVNLSVGFLFYPGAHPSATFDMVRDSWGLAGLVFFVPFFLRHASLWGHGVLSYLGRISYSVYLIHGVILLLLERTAIRGVPFVLATFVSAIAVASLSYRLIESPPIKFGHRLKSMKSRATSA